ncbi:MAG TPA: prepilin-type N-terminal cleavage/methylation domain-containing protein [Firmicutes bacterium]|nr:prepilin-type N-terminal cleavage/methylation domain-containing protein [Bacillota bacterium]
MKRDQRGFTLMELMIVIVIIGVLAAIGVPAYNNYVNKAKAAACLSNRRTIATAMGLYYAEHTTYPPTTADLVDYLDNVEALKCPMELDKADNYEIVTDPTSGEVVIRCKGRVNETKHPHEDLVVGTVTTP